MLKKSARKKLPAQHRQSSPPHHSRWYSYTFLLINVVVWSLAFFMVKPAYEVTTPFRYLLYRFLIAAVVSWPILLYYWRRVPNLWSNIKTIVALEFLGNGLALALVYSGLHFTTALEANLMTSPLPIFITLGGILLLREKQEKHEWWGLGLSFMGTLWLILGPLVGSAVTGSVFHVSSLFGNVLIMGHNLVNMLYYPLAKKYYDGLPKFFVTSVSFYASISVFVVLSLAELWLSGVSGLTEIVSVVQTDLSSPSVWVASGYMAIFGSIIGLTTYIKGQEGIEASEASWFAYLGPLVYVPVGVFILNETIHFYQIVALAVILLGVMIAEKRFGKR